MWQRIKTWFLDSETIFLARLQTLVGLILATVQATDPGALTPYIPAQWIAVFLIVWGLLSEMARRRRDDMKAKARAAGKTSSGAG